MIKEKFRDFIDSLEMEEENEVEQMNDLEKHKRKRQKKKQAKYILFALITVIVLVVFLILKYTVDHRTYDSYRVVSSDVQFDSSILHYKELGGNVLKYSGDGVSLLNASNRVIWNDSIQMTSPIVISFKDVAAIYETRGNLVCIYGTKGKLGEIKTKQPILKACVSGQGGVALLLENGENTLMQYYASDGNLIASSSSNMKNPGYPIDLSVSEDGLSMAITYFVADADVVSSYLAFYNFSEAGKKKEDNLVDGFRFEGELIPDVQYLDKDTLIACGEKGFSVYQGTDILEVVESVEFEDEIVSSFFGEDMCGFIFRSREDEYTFEMKVYNSSGRLKMKTGFDIFYDKIKTSGKQIMLYNSNQLTIIDSNGAVRFSGAFEEGKIYDIVRNGINRYTVACDKGIVTIMLD